MGGRWLIIVNPKTHKERYVTFESLPHVRTGGVIHQPRCVCVCVFPCLSQNSPLVNLQLLVTNSHFPPTVPQYNTSPWLVPLHIMSQLTEYNFILSPSHCQRITSRWIYLQLTEGDSAIVCPVQEQTVIYHTQTKTYSSKHTSTQTHTRMELINHQSV